MEGQISPHSAMGIHSASQSPRAVCEWREGESTIVGSVLIYHCTVWLQTLSQIFAPTNKPMFEPSQPHTILSVSFILGYIRHNLLTHMRQLKKEIWGFVSNISFFPVRILLKGCSHGFTQLPLCLADITASDWILLFPFPKHKKTR